MLEEIKIYVMKRLYKIYVYDYKCVLNLFEVRNEIMAYTVNLINMRCSCRQGELNGIGCPYSVATLSFLNRDPLPFISSWFSNVMYLKSHEVNIIPMNGSDMCPTTNYLTLYPQKVG